MGHFRKCSVQVSCPLLPSISSDFKAAKFSFKLSFLEITYAPNFYIDDPSDLDAWDLLWIVIKANLLREELHKLDARVPQLKHLSQSSRFLSTAAKCTAALSGYCPTLTAPPLESDECPSALRIGLKHDK